MLQCSAGNAGVAAAVTRDWEPKLQREWTTRNSLVQQELDRAVWLLQTLRGFMRTALGFDSCFLFTVILFLIVEIFVIKCLPIKNSSMHSDAHYSKAALNIELVVLLNYMPEMTAHTNVRK